MRRQKITPTCLICFLLLFIVSACGTRVGNPDDDGDDDDDKDLDIVSAPLDDGTSPLYLVVETSLSMCVKVINIKGKNGLSLLNQAAI